MYVNYIYDDYLTWHHKFIRHSISLTRLTSTAWPLHNLDRTLIKLQTMGSYKV